MTCVAGFNASESHVRCSATWEYLLDADTNSTSTVGSDTDGDVNVTGTPGLSGGAIAGIVVGCVAALVLIVLGLWFCLRRRYKGRSNAPPPQYQPQQQAPQPGPGPAPAIPPMETYYPPQKNMIQEPQQSPQWSPSSERQELAGTQQPSELDGTTDRTRSPISPWSSDRGEKSPLSPMGR